MWANIIIIMHKTYLSINYLIRSNYITVIIYIYKDIEIEINIYYVKEVTFHVK